MTLKAGIFAGLVCLASVAVASGEPSADLIIHGGPILTMEGAKPGYVEAVVVSDGRIAFAGAATEAMQQKSAATVVKDLGGRTMLPGFVDAHSHFINAPTLSRMVNVSPSPVGPGDSVAQIIAALQAWQGKTRVPDGGWIMAWGYDDSMVQGGKLTKRELDAALPSHKVMVFHVSLHGAVLNSQALEWAGITRDTPTPEGGIIARGPDGKEPEGLLMETAFLPVFSRLPQPGEEARLELLKPGQMMYAEHGYTLANDGFTHAKDISFLQKAAAQGRLFIDVVVLPAFSEMDQWLGKPEFPFGEWHDRLKLQGLKITQDGSVQGKTASYLEPLLTGGPQGQKDWRGNTTLPYEDFARLFAAGRKAGLQVFVHANGDGAIQQAIKAAAAAGVKAGDDSRTIVIHSQMQHPEDIPRYVALGLTPTYFTNHTFFWGDVHRQNIGEERAAFISPMKAAMDAGLKATNHSDFNVTPLDPLFMLWTSMARTTRSGHVLGPDQRIDAYRGLQALTVNPAWEYREESRRGSIAPGKLADFVILSADPLETPVDAIRDIEVVETIKEGRTIYARH
ncbi:MAG: amidohydrolase [Steroidobacteraceae bacterium]|nr:amidohydrolase [Steroidobacteraceae bacterium]